jgi:hypothetical protein
MAVFINTTYDGELILSKKYLSDWDHHIRTIIRFVFFTGNAIFFIGINYKIIPLIFFQFALWWPLFDMCLNLYIGQDWNYMGDGKEWYEKFKSWQQQMIVKLSLIGIAITALFIFL